MSYQHIVIFEDIRKWVLITGALFFLDHTWARILDRQINDHANKRNL
jgi:hypothetical protein